tara:strand:- start:181 stop:1092 length:912 start_codon:yes stop_codon:yes gene_type:complete
MNKTFKGISSILIPIYNSEYVINDCLFSLSNSKEINEYDVELILINDGSLDNTDKLIKSFIKEKSEKLRIKYISHEKNLGIVKALNSGIRKCNSEYIFRLDADDKWVEGRLVKSLSKFKDLDSLKQNYAIVGTYMRGSSGRIYKSPKVVDSLFQHFFGGFVHHPTWCIKGEILRKYLYKTKSPFDDYYLLMRLILDDYKFYNIPEVLVIYNDSIKSSSRLTFLNFDIRAINSLLIKFAFLRFWIRSFLRIKNQKKTNKYIFINEVKNIINKNSRLKESKLISFFARYVNSVLYKTYIFFKYRN